MQKLVALMAFAALLALPGAMAAYVSTGDITGPFADAAGLEAPVYYLNSDGSLWEETNGFDGLQMEAIVDELGNVIGPADTNVAPGFGSVPTDLPGVGLPEAPGLPEMPGVEVPALPELPGL